MSLSKMISHFKLYLLLLSVASLDLVKTSSTISNADNEKNLSVCDSNAMDFSGINLEKAAREGDVECMKKILESSPNLTEDDIRWALQSAAAFGHSECLNLLLGKKSDLSTNRYFGQALHRAAVKGQEECMKILLETNIPEDYIIRSLDSAARGGHAGCVKVIFESKHEISDDLVKWAIYYAAGKGRSNCVKQILELRPKISIDHVGGALQAAAQQGYEECVQLILDSRPNISQIHLDWALREAQKNMHSQVEELLLSKPHIEQS